MTAADLRAEPVHSVASFAALSPTRLLASALIHVLDRDEPPPARWLAESFIAAVAAHRSALAPATDPSELDRRAAPTADLTFRGAVAALASDPLAAALAVRCLELLRSAGLPAWPVIVRHGVGPRVTRADQGRWFG